MSQHISLCVSDVVSPPGGCSKAVLWLGQLKLSCSEEQLGALVGLLTHSLAFGPISSWGTDVFIEIGALAGEGHSLAAPASSNVLTSLSESHHIYFYLFIFGTLSCDWIQTFVLLQLSLKHFHFCSWSPRLPHVSSGERANRRNHSHGYFNDTT